MKNLNTIRIRNAKPSDHENIISVIPDWWGGRDLSNSVPKLLLIYFSPTSFVAIKNSELCGFLIGFFSQSFPNEGYIHFAGVHPEFRSNGLAKTLYQKFYDVCSLDSRNIIRSCTAPINKLSIFYSPLSEYFQTTGFTQLIWILDNISQKSKCSLDHLLSFQKGISSSGIDFVREYPV